MTQYSLSGVIRVNFLKMSMFLIVKHHKWPITDKYIIKNQVREVWKIALKLDTDLLKLTAEKVNG